MWRWTAAGRHASCVTLLVEHLGLRIWDFHTVFFILAHCACMKSLQSRLILCDPMDYSPPGFSVHGILQVNILEWVAMPSSRGSSWPRDRTCVSYVSCIGRWVLHHWATRETLGSLGGRNIYYEWKSKSSISHQGRRNKLSQGSETGRVEWLWGSGVGSPGFPPGAYESTMWLWINPINFPELHFLPL